MKLVIAEKPSVAMALASVIGARTRKDGYVEGNGYLVSWCVGHLVGLCDASEYDEKYKKWRYEDLPIVPECWKHRVLEGTKKQFGILKKLMRDSKVDEVICATDAGREGELIFRLVYEQAGCKKPMKRLWISSMEEQAIKDGFASLKDGSCYDSLYQSALCRATTVELVKEVNETQVERQEQLSDKVQFCDGKTAVMENAERRETRLEKAKEAEKVTAKTEAKGGIHGKLEKAKAEIKAKGADTIPKDKAKDLATVL